MTLLVILALLAVVAVYAVFFLVFKLIWILLKKNSNKWPLIWAGVCTVVFGVLFVGFTAWGVYKVVSPFKGMITRLQNNPQPVYGERVYTDPVYRFDLDVFNGMDFSNWMEFDDIDAKVGVDMNAFRNYPSDEEEDANERQFMAVLLLRQDDVDEGHPLQALREALASTDHRQDLEILSQEDFTLDGYPAMFATGRAYARNGKRMFLAVTAVADAYRQVFYVIAFSPDYPEAVENATQTARSLRLENGSSLPGETAPALPQEEAAAPAAETTK